MCNHDSNSLPFKGLSTIYGKFNQDTLKYIVHIFQIFSGDACHARKVERCDVSSILPPKMLELLYLFKTRDTVQGASPEPVELLDKSISCPCPVLAICDLGSANQSYDFKL